MRGQGVARSLLIEADSVSLTHMLASPYVQDGRLTWRTAAKSTFLHCISVLKKQPPASVLYKATSCLLRGFAFCSGGQECKGAVSTE